MKCRRLSKHEVRAYLSDILVPHSANLLDICSALRDSLNGVSRKLDFILDVGGNLNLDTGLASDTADNLLAEEVSA